VSRRRQRFEESTAAQFLYCVILAGLLLVLLLGILP
jgi:hypothetical protein